MTRDLYVKHLPADMTEDELRNLFSVSGRVTYIHMVHDAASNEFVGCAFVKMSSEAEAKDAINCLDGARLRSRDIIVMAARPQAPKSPGNRKKLAGNRRNTPAQTGQQPSPPKQGTDRVRSEARVRTGERRDRKR